MSLVVSLHLGREDERGGGGVPSVAALAAAAAASAIKTNQSCTVCWNSALGMLTDETTSTLQKQLTCSRLQQPAGGAAHRKLAGDLDTAEAANQQPAPACCGRRGGGVGGLLTGSSLAWTPYTARAANGQPAPAGRQGRSRSKLAGAFRERSMAAALPPRPSLPQRGREARSSLATIPMERVRAAARQLFGRVCRAGWG